MRFKLTSVVFIFLLAVQVACAQPRQSQKQQEAGIPGPPAPEKSTEKVEDVSAQVDKSRVKKQAQEMTDAFIAGDFEKMADLTYPDLVYLLGGKDKMVAGLKKEAGGWSAQGFRILAMPVDEPKRVIKSRDYLLTVVPVKMRMKMPDGVYVQQTSYIGASQDGGRNWTFVDARGGDKQKLKILFAMIPSAIDELELPSETPPVRESDQ
ncbi:MAG TPA: hypothetical protein VD835_15575 [Pyrinomonadaceae bacterium]|nr:hypothetical protein [Pyrinomonadaceae bacterium]